MKDVRVLRILVVDDERETRRSSVEVLREAGHAVTAVSDGKEALVRLRDDFFHLVLLELDMEGQVDGNDILTAIGWRWPKTATIAYTRRDSLNAAIQAIGEGIDGYLTKAGEPGAILKAVDDALRRRRVRCCAEAEEGILRWGTLELDQRRRQVTLDDRTIELSPSQFAILRHLMRSAHRVVSPDELFLEIRRDPPLGDEDVARIVRYHIYQLRKKLAAGRDSPYHIRTVYGQGYTLGGPDD